MMKGNEIICSKIWLEIEIIFFNAVLFAGSLHMSLTGANMTAGYRP